MNNAVLHSLLTPKQPDALLPHLHVRILAD
jgi:hypothetical protein